MLYLIGLGLNESGLSKEGIKIIKKCKTVYLEAYTIEFPYKIEELKLNKKIIELKREEVESNKLIKKARKEDIALLIYGSPLFATTHISLILEAEKQKIKTKIIYSASIFDAIAETGLQLYKFGKILSMPQWTKNYQPKSFLDFFEQNESIKAHSLILVDIGLNFKNALKQLEESFIDFKGNKTNIKKILICSRMGSKNAKIIYRNMKDLKKLSNKKILAPFCFIIPSKMHFLEKNFVEKFS